MADLLTDRFGRSLHDLRISITDACNLNCVYCAPPDGFKPQSSINRLRADEFVRIARIFVGMGGEKIRLTGGEPLLSPDILTIISEVSPISGLRDVGLTTNGMRLASLAHSLAKVGLKRINISLDSLDPRRFMELTGRDGLDQVLRGMEAAYKAGIAIKLNVVAIRGVKKELFRFSEMVQNPDVEIRFIEFMPLCGTGWHPEWVVPMREIENYFHRTLPLIPLCRESQTAKTYQIVGGGRVGFIASLSEPFCDHCSRIRLGCDGRIYPCLFSSTTVDLKGPMRQGVSDQDLESLIRRAVMMKEAGHGVKIATANPIHMPKIRVIGG